MKKVPLRLNQENMATSVGRETKIFVFRQAEEVWFYNDGCAHRIWTASNLFQEAPPKRSKYGNVE